MVIDRIAEREARWPKLHGASHWLDRLVGWLDSAVPIPGTRYRVGLDPILGLLFPTAGDVTGGAVSLTLVFLALQYRLPTWVVARMVGNLVVDAAVGGVPILGDLFDFAFKANERNLALLREHQARSQPARMPLRYWLTAGLLLIAALACVMLPIVVTVVVLRALFAGGTG